MERMEASVPIDYFSVSMCRFDSVPRSGKIGLNKQVDASQVHHVSVIQDKGVSLTIYFWIIAVVAHRDGCEVCRHDWLFDGDSEAAMIRTDRSCARLTMRYVTLLKKALLVPSVAVSKNTPSSMSMLATNSSSTCTGTSS